jgi:septal ring factor EnvC (AmiA/AmiB activator)
VLVKEHKNFFIRPFILLLTLLFVLGFVLGFVLEITPAMAQETEKQHLEKIQREMDTAKEKRDKLNEQAKATMAEISAIQSELIVQARQVQNKESSLERISEDIILLEGETRKEEKDLMAKQKGMVQTLSSLERLSERPPALILTRPQKGIDTLRSAKLLAATLPGIKTAADEIIRDITALKAARLKLRGEKDKQASLLASLVDDRHVLDDFLKRRQTKRSLLIADAENQGRRIQKLAKEAKDLSSLINKLELDRIAQNIARAKAAKEAEERLSKGGTKPTAGGGTLRPSHPSLNAPAPGAKSFRQAKGTMPIPARGRITQTFGSQLEAERAKGIRIQTRFGAQVIAPHDGTIVFSGPFRDYGNIVIITHGAGYHSLFAGLLSENTSVGQWVLAGEPIGIMPDKLSTTAQNNAQNGLQSKSGGKPAGPSLYIEFRQNNKPFNPLAWLKRQRRKITG